MRIEEITRWVNSETKIISLTQDVGSAKYNLQVRRFVPQKGDFLERTWKSEGNEQSYRCAAYAIQNMRAAAEDFSKFVDVNIDTFIAHYIPKDNTLLHETYMMAYKYMHIAEVSLRIRSRLRLTYQIRAFSEKRRSNCSSHCFDCGSPVVWRLNRNESVVQKLWECRHKTGTARLAILGTYVSRR